MIRKPRHGLAPMCSRTPKNGLARPANSSGQKKKQTTKSRACSRWAGEFIWEAMPRPPRRSADRTKKIMRAVRNQITARLRSDGSRLPPHRTTTDLSLRAFVGNFGLSFDIDAVPCDLTPLPSRTQISNVSKNGATEDHQQDNANRRPHHDPAHADDTHGTCTRRRTGHEACDGLDAVAKEPPDARHTLGGHRERAGQLAKATPNDEESQHAQRNRFRVLRSLHVSEQVLLAYTPHTHLQKIEAGAQPRIICNPLTNGASIIHDR
mmetsp:Transcript_51117/g.146764  ORF Transcript_51117/g.146764 Transcript_51117/m.146764 type:complete len:265 (-) Transcript_51117:290-1084(-)